MNCFIWIYPWDLQDEGIPQVLDRLQENNISGINVTANYHSGMFFLPHNPKRKVIFPEPGALYFPPNSAWYENSKIKPPVSKFASKKFWEDLREESKKRGMTMTAWTLALHNSFIGFNYPQTTVVNAFGDHYPTALCPANKSLRDFFVEFYNDVSSNYDFDNILIESLEYMPFRHGYHHEVIGVPINATIDFFMSLSFSSDLCKKANELGINIEDIKCFVRSKCEEAFANPFSSNVEMSWDEIVNSVDGEMKAYLELREELITSLFKEIAEVINSNTEAKISALDFGPLYPLGPRNVSWQNGVNLRRISKYIEEIHPTFYFTDMDLFKNKVDEYIGVLDKLDKKLDMVPAIRAVLPQVGNQEDLRKQVNILKPYSAGMTFYNYGFMAYQSLKWISSEISR